MPAPRLFPALAPFAALAIAGAALAAPATKTTAPTTRNWTSDDILAVKQVSDPRMSPDGRWVAYVVNAINADGSEFQTDVWLVPAAGGEARQLTSSPAADEFPRWSPDGRTLAFLSERPRPGVKPDAPTADEGKRQIWMIRPDGGEAWLASDAKGGVSMFEWSRDGRTIGYLSREPKSDERRKAEKDKNDAWTPAQMYAWNRLWVMDVATRKATQLTRGDLHVSWFSLSPDGRRVVYAAQPTPLIPDNFKSDLYVAPTAGGNATTLVARPGGDNRPMWSPDGQQIAFVSQDPKNTKWQANNYLCVVSPGGGAVRTLTATFDEQIDGLGSGGAMWMPDSRSLVFQANQRTAQHVFRAWTDGRVEPLTSGPEMYSAFSCDARGERAVLMREDSEHPREVVSMAVAGGTPTPLTDTNPQARAMRSLKKELVQWKGADGRDIEGLLIYPVNYRAGHKVPLILNVHGGPAGTNSNTCTVASRLYPWPLFAQQGYAILLPNPRGSGGYGEAFRMANLRDWGGADYEDLMKGVDAMIERGIADPTRMAVCGWSYGGYMTSTIVTKTDRFKAAVVGAGVTDLGSMAGTCDIPEFNYSYFDSWPWEDAKFYVDHSALYHAGNVKTPTSLVHGLADERVPTSQGWEFYTAMKKVGVPTDLLLLPRQPHGPREPRLLKAAQQWHLDWINKYTLGIEPAGKPRPVKLAPDAEKGGSRTATSGTH